MKVLISAYACQPHRGSEPGIGWNTARQMAKRHNIWVITRGDNRPAIEAELAAHPVPSLHVVYYDLPGWKRKRHALQAHYWFWQFGIYQVARALHRQIHFDLAHHVSYVRWWTPSLLALLPIPFVWGPVGGGESVAPAFRKDLSLRARLEEAMRSALARLSMYNPLVRLTARHTTLAMANNDQTAARVKQLGVSKIWCLSESCVDRAAFVPINNSADTATNGAVRFASLTRLVHWKGVHLGLRAFASLHEPDAQYWIVGEGPERQRLQTLATRLGVADRVLFREHLSRPEWLRILRQCDALVHPCLANSGSMISLEAMAARRPVICLDISGIRSQVTPRTGFIISADNPEQAVAGLADAMRSVIRDRASAQHLALRAQKHVQAHFTWESQAEQLNAAYVEATSRP